MATNQEDNLKNQKQPQETESSMFPNNQSQNFSERTSIAFARTTLKLKLFLRFLKKGSSDDDESRVEVFNERMLKHKKIIRSL